MSDQGIKVKKGKILKVIKLIVFEINFWNIGYFFHLLRVYLLCPQKCFANIHFWLMELHGTHEALSFCIDGENYFAEVPGHSTLSSD